MHWTRNPWISPLLSQHLFGSLKREKPNPGNLITLQMQVCMLPGMICFLVMKIEDRLAGAIGNCNNS